MVLKKSRFENCPLSPVFFSEASPGSSGFLPQALPSLRQFKKPIDAEVCIDVTSSARSLPCSSLGNEHFECEDEVSVQCVSGQEKLSSPHRHPSRILRAALLFSLQVFFLIAVRLVRSPLFAAYRNSTCVSGRMTAVCTQTCACSNGVGHSHLCCWLHVWLGSASRPHFDQIRPLPSSHATTSRPFYFLCCCFPMNPSSSPIALSMCTSEERSLKYSAFLNEKCHKGRVSQCFPGHLTLHPHSHHCTTSRFHSCHIFGFMHFYILAQMQIESALRARLV